jgi:ATP-dependent Clp protease ATP-binding subunit ClpB
MNFSFDKLTTKSQEAIAGAQRLATTKGNPEIGGLHLLAAALEERDGAVAPIFAAIGVDVVRLKKAVDAEIDRLPRVEGTTPSPSAELQKIFVKAAEEATRAELERISSTVNTKTKTRSFGGFGSRGTGLIVGGIIGVLIAAFFIWIELSSGSTSQERGTGIVLALVLGAFAL